MRPSNSGSLASLSDGTCCVGITRRWVGAWGLMSRNAISPSPRFTIVAGISPAATLQKRQPDMGLLPSERLADLLPELLAAALFRRRLRLDHGEPLQQLLLLRRETRGGPDPHTHVQLAPPAPAALGTRLRDHRSLAAARGTGRDGDELPEHRARLAPHLPGAAARAAGRGPRALLGARSTARRAAIQRAHAHGLRRPRGDFGQRELECHLQVRPTVPVASALAAAEDRVEPAQAPEVAHEDVERLGQVEMREAEPALPAPPGARRPPPQARL